MFLLDRKRHKLKHGKHQELACYEVPASRMAKVIIELASAERRCLDAFLGGDTDL
jgi:hypothetical protein